MYFKHALITKFAISAIIVGVGSIVYLGIQKQWNEIFSIDVKTIFSNEPLSNADIIAKVKPATVFIETEYGVGSGMLIESNGHILTNAHVVSGVSVAKVKLSDRSIYSAEVLGRDEILDLAMLRIVGGEFPVVTLGDSDEVEQGEEVFTLGYPFGLEGDVSFKEGTISRKIIDNDMTYLETSAEIHPGNSGGPLVNEYGDVVGINTAIYGEEFNGTTVGEVIKLAIPINFAKLIFSDLKIGRNIVVEKQIQPSQDNKKIQQKNELDECIKIAEQYTIDAFNSICPGFANATVGEKLNCEQDIDIGQLIDVLNEKEDKDKMECYMRYPQF